MCTHHVHLILQQTSCESLSSFQWTDLICELQKHAPTLMCMLKACMKTRCHKQNRSGVFELCATLLLKFQYNRWSLVQKLIFTILCNDYNTSSNVNYVIIKWNFSPKNWIVKMPELSCSFCLVFSSANCIPLLCTSECTSNL